MAERGNHHSIRCCQPLPPTHSAHTTHRQWGSRGHLLPHGAPGLLRCCACSIAAGASSLLRPEGCGGAREHRRPAAACAAAAGGYCRRRQGLTDRSTGLQAPLQQLLHAAAHGPGKLQAPRVLGHSLKLQDPNQDPRLATQSLWQCELVLLKTTEVPGEGWTAATQAVKPHKARLSHKRACKPAIEYFRDNQHLVVAQFRWQQCPASACAALAQLVQHYQSRSQWTWP